MTMDLAGRPERLLSPADLADYLGVPLSTVYAWRSKSLDPTGFTIGRHVRYRQSDVDEWIDARALAQPAKR